MRKISIFLAVVLVLLMAVSVYAGPRENLNDPGKTGLTNISVVGEDIPRVPGYIEFATSDINGKEMRWFMYVTPDGDVYVASSAQVTTQSPTKSTDWGWTLGSKVGDQ